MHSNIHAFDITGKDAQFNFDSLLAGPTDLLSAQEMYPFDCHDGE